MFGELSIELLEAVVLASGDGSQVGRESICPSVDCNHVSTLAGGRKSAAGLVG